MFPEGNFRFTFSDTFAVACTVAVLGGARGHRPPNLAQPPFFIFWLHWSFLLMSNV